MRGPGRWPRRRGPVCRGRREPGRSARRWSRRRRRRRRSLRPAGEVCHARGEVVVAHDDVVCAELAGGLGLGLGRDGRDDARAAGFRELREELSHTAGGGVDHDGVAGGDGVHVGGEVLGGDALHLGGGGYRRRDPIRDGDGVRGGYGRVLRVRAEDIRPRHPLPDLKAGDVGADLDDGAGALEPGDERGGEAERPLADLDVEVVHARVLDLHENTVRSGGGPVDLGRLKDVRGSVPGDLDGVHDFSVHWGWCER